MEKKREANFIKKDNFCLFCGERHIRGGKGKKIRKEEDIFGFETLLLVRACPSVTYHQHSIVSHQGCAQLQLCKNLRPQSAQLCLVPFQLLRVIVEILLPGNALFVRWFVRHKKSRPQTISHRPVSTGSAIAQSAPVTMANVTMVDVTVVDITMVEVIKVEVTFVVVTAKGKD